MSLTVGETSRESLIVRASEALARRLSKRREKLPAVSLAMSHADRDRVILVAISGETLATYQLVRERGTLQLRWRDPKRSR